MTEDGIRRLAENCPNLRRVQLQGTEGLTDRALIFFFQNCADLTDLEISPVTGGGGWKLMTGTAFDALRSNPEWAPKLIRLRMEKYEKPPTFMKAMRELTKTRQKLLVQLVDVRSYCEHKHDDDTLRVDESNYLDGRIRNQMKHIKRGKEGYRYEKPVWDPKRYEAYQNWQHRRASYWAGSDNWSQSRFWRELRRAGVTRGRRRHWY